MYFIEYLLVFTALVIGADAAALNSTDRMSSVDYSKVVIVEKPLPAVELADVVPVLSRGLLQTFEDVSVSVVDTPDLTQPPYNLAAPGINGDVKLIEIGGPPYLLPLVQRDKIYDLKELLQHLRRDPGFLVGAGAGPWPHVGVNCEGIINVMVAGGAVRQGTRIVTVQPAGGYLQQRVPADETRTALLGNYLLSDGKPGKALKIVAKTRKGKSNFITAIRETLKNHFGDTIIGMGGTFLLRSGSGKYHVMPEFSSRPLTTDAEVDEWLHFFEMPSPIVHVGTLVTGDYDLDLRVQHFHGWGGEAGAGAGGVGGHYHYDTTPGAAHYEGYFVLAGSIIRVDAPAETHNVGRD